MDPDSNLEELRRLLKQVRDGAADEMSAHEVRLMRNRAERAAELFEALDDWIRCGGFLPKDWLHGAQSDGPDIDLDESEAP